MTSVASAPNKLSLHFLLSHESDAQHTQLVQSAPAVSSTPFPCFTGPKELQPVSKSVKPSTCSSWHSLEFIDYSQSFKKSVQSNTPATEEKIRICDWCETTKTSRWRQVKQVQGEVTNRLQLCNACGLHFYRTRFRDDVKRSPSSKDAHFRDIRRTFSSHGSPRVPSCHPYK